MNGTAKSKSGSTAGKNAASAAKKSPPSGRARTGRRRIGRGALGLIAGLLVASGLIRLSDGVGQVMALEMAPHDQDMAAAVPASGDGCLVDAGTAALLKALQVREARLQTEEATIEERRQALVIAESRIQERLGELVGAEAALAETLALADKASEADLARLTSVYENMKPKEAAALFAEMEPAFAAGFLSRMRPEAAAGVMAGLEPKTAYAISAVLAGRNATVPKD